MIMTITFSIVICFFLNLAAGLGIWAVSKVTETYVQDDALAIQEQFRDHALVEVWFRVDGVRTAIVHPCTRPLCCSETLKASPGRIFWPVRGASKPGSRASGSYIPNPKMHPYSRYLGLTGVPTWVR